MKKAIKRFTIGGQFIGNGTLHISDHNGVMQLTYTEGELSVAAEPDQLPLIALENLRTSLEEKHQSILGLTGCRKDTVYRATGGSGSYKIYHGRPATDRVNIFEPTDDVSQLTTISDQKRLTQIWVDSVMKK